MAIAYERRIQLAGSFNFRDLGGYETTDGRSVRWRRLFRSDALHRLTEDDIELLGEIGLTAVFDLRSSDELDRDGLGMLFDDGVTHRHVPFTQHVGAERGAGYFGSSLADLYERMLEGAQPCINAVFSALAEPETYPAVFHCAAGKDRTGMISGLVLSALGVPDEQIIADYAITDGLMADRLETMRAAEQLDTRYGEIPAHVLRAEPATMAATLAMIQREHGSVEGYLGACDITDTQIRALRKQLLD